MSSAAQSLLSSIAFTVAIVLATACQTDTATYRNALTGEACEPNDTYRPRGNSGDHGRGNQSPTGIPGDNLDDDRSGKVDCYWDGNSGQGDDKKHGCVPPPGCDDEGCCDDVPPAPEDPADPEDPEEPIDPEDPTDPEEPADPTEPPSSCEDTCQTDSDCGSDELVCEGGCCAPLVR